MLPSACRRGLIFAFMTAIVGGSRIKPLIAIGSSDQDMSLLESRRLEVAPSVQREIQAFMADPLIQQRLTTFAEQLKANTNLQKQLQSIKADPLFLAEAEAVYKKLALQSEVFEEQLNANPSLQQQLDKMTADPKLQHQMGLVQMMLGDDASKGDNAHHADARGAGTSLAEVTSVSTQLPRGVPTVHAPMNAARWLYNHPRQSLLYAFILSWLYPVYVGSELQIEWGSCGLILSLLLSTEYRGGRFIVG